MKADKSELEAAISRYENTLRTISEKIEATPLHLRNTGLAADIHQIISDALNPESPFFDRPHSD
jgi:hypothetical protein